MAHLFRDWPTVERLIAATAKPVIVAGDFNTFWGEHEMYLFCEAARLRSAVLVVTDLDPADPARIEAEVGGAYELYFDLEQPEGMRGSEGCTVVELEPVRRGPYCGAIGYVGFDGTMDTSIAIRTLVAHQRQVSFHVGGGIVAIVPGEMAIVAFSPRLSEAGNSVRGTGAIRHISKALDLSVFRP